jgi:hypothetical protein
MRPVPLLLALGLPLYRSTLLISRLGLLAKKARSGLQ